MYLKKKKSYSPPLKGGYYAAPQVNINQIDTTDILALPTRQTKLYRLPRDQCLVLKYYVWGEQDSTTIIYDATRQENKI